MVHGKQFKHGISTPSVINGVELITKETRMKVRGMFWGNVK